MKEFLSGDSPPYAILSHTWDVEEVSFRDMVFGASAKVKAKKGYRKIEQTCRIAAAEGIEYAWVDTCAIDKSSSAELTEAINSMFQYYQRAEVCYAYLADLPPDVSEADGFYNCRWFTRGWTLQELLAPSNLVFYDVDWKPRGTKKSAAVEVSKVTGIRPNYVTNGQWAVRFPSVAERMSWAARRTTTRVEDMAYCLLGLFGINMPMLYGEGQNAFLRLQEEIVKRTNDLTLLAWKPDVIDQNTGCMGVLAATPSLFRSCGELQFPYRANEFSVTNKGIKIKTQLKTMWMADMSGHQILQIGSSLDAVPVYISLLQVGPGQYIRAPHLEGGFSNTHTPGQFEGQTLRMQTIYLVHDPSHGVSLRDIKVQQQEHMVLVLRGNPALEVFEAIPEGVWDPVRGTIVDQSSPVALLLGRADRPYGSVYLIIIQQRPRSAVYFIPASSPAIPYVLSNLMALRMDELDTFWAIKPVPLELAKDDRYTSLGYDKFIGSCLITENLKVDLSASVRIIRGSVQSLVIEASAAPRETQPPDWKKGSKL
jgi:hypothetical protein